MQCARCHAGLPAGSLFCNSCGTPVAAGGASSSASQPTQMYQAPAQQYQPPVQPYRPNVTQQPGTMQPYAPTPNGYHAPPLQAPPVPGKKPVALLIAILSLVAVGVVGAGVMMWRNANPSVVSAGQRPAEPGAPVTQTASSSLPEGPSVVSGQVPAPPKGQPVTGTASKPDDGVPSILMAPGSQAPQGGSVTSVHGPSVPKAPGVLQVQQSPRPAAPPVTSAPQQPSPQASPQAAPPPPNNADFDRYILWLRRVENMRADLRARGETEQFRIIERFYSIMLGLAEPDANDAQIQAQFDRELQSTLQGTVAYINNFQAQMARTKPPVPVDCGALDQHYMRAVTQEVQMTAALMQALARKDIGSVKRVGSSVGSIDMSLGMANKQLEKVYEGRGLNQQFVIQTGGSSSMLGGLMGLGPR